MIRPSIAAASAAFLLSGCIVADVVTAPVKVAAGTVDLLTESQAEKEEKRGRELRKRRSGSASSSGTMPSNCANAMRAMPRNAPRPARHGTRWRHSDRRFPSSPTRLPRAAAGR
ncbi:DUF6726 family protein [Blastomonas marina]|nr:DUF6726 family protein [Blastomonas marina]WPZ05349.1 DUF6726 family protein [Blastomonas marina]